MSELGVKGAKPRFRPAEDQLPELCKTYLETRSRQMRSKAQTAEMLLAKARGELVLKSLVERQAAYLLVSLRQKILNFPSTYARKILGLTDVNQASAILREMAISVLNEIKDLPQAAIDPGWLKKLDDGAEDGKS
jgi:hypothetical protein